MSSSRNVFSVLASRAIIAAMIAILSLTMTAPLLATPVSATKTNPTVKYCLRNHLDLRFGDRGECVKTIQTFLKFAVGGRDVGLLCPTYASRNGLKRSLSITSEFDFQTRLYMKCFQEWQGLKTDGVADTRTYKKMNYTCREDNSYAGIPKGDNTKKSFKDYWFCNYKAKSVYLTFDDGPVPKWTQAVMDILDKKNVKATFYVVGWKVVTYPDIALDIFRRGHSIQNHSYGHPDLVTYPDWAVYWQLEQASIAIKNATKRWPTCMRPPYGSTNTRVNNIAASLGMKTIIWTKNSADYSHQSSAVLYSQSKQWGAGDIVLGHDTWGSLWVRVLDQIIDDIRDKGLEFDSMCKNPKSKPY